MNDALISLSLGFTMKFTRVIFMFAILYSDFVFKFSQIFFFLFILAIGILLADCLNMCFDEIIFAAIRIYRHIVCAVRKLCARCVHGHFENSLLFENKQKWYIFYVWKVVRGFCICWSTLRTLSIYIFIHTHWKYDNVIAVKRTLRFCHTNSLFVLVCIANGQEQGLSFGHVLHCTRCVSNRCFNFFLLLSFISH